jgi:hypothetical protein
MISKESVVAQLNRLLELDRNLLEKLIDTRYPVTKEYADSEEFICMVDDPENPVAGLLGVLNGLLDEGVPIAAVYDEDMKLISFVLHERP